MAGTVARLADGLSHGSHVRAMGPGALVSDTADVVVANSLPWFIAVPSVAFLPAGTVASVAIGVSIVMEFTDLPWWKALPIVVVGLCALLGVGLALYR